VNETTQDAWFFTQEGEQLGPVPLADLRIKAAEGALNPRLDMVWTQGMAEWKPAGEVEGLFEKRAAPEEPEALAPAANPYKPPQQGDGAVMMNQEGGWPGARRRSFLIMTMLFPIAWHFVFAFGVVFLVQLLGPEIMAIVALGGAFLPVVVAIYFGLMRLVNVGMSRWWYLANFVPFLNLWVGYRMFACPAGYAYHKKLDGPGIALAIIYWLMLALAIIAMIAAFALLFGAIDNPEIRQQLQEAIRKAQEGAGRR
jgi:hypothetical protein